MKAIVLEKTGGVENFVVKDVEKPKLKLDEVLVEVKAISINPVDYKTRTDDAVLEMICGTKTPLILGWDIAGKVVAVGDEVTLFEIGDDVFGMVNFPGVGNGYAEFVSVPENQLAKIPAGCSYVDAAAATLAALTAFQVLKGRVKQGDRVLIHAGSGGVGHFAIQIAKSMGAYVITTCSAKNRNFVMSVGADRHIDYSKVDFQDLLEDIDFALDGLGGETLLNTVKVMKNGGSIISLPTPEFSGDVIAAAKEKNVNVSFLLVQSSGEDMNTLSRLLANKAIKAHVSKVFAFPDIAVAHQAVEGGRTVGKVVVKL